MTGTPVPTAVRGGTVYRIVWEPGSDRLAGTCHCGAERTCEDPVLLWQWLVSHPDHPGHPGPAGARE